MNLKLSVFHLQSAFRDNPATGVLAASCAAALLFFGCVVLPQYLRRMKRRRRERLRR